MLRINGNDYQLRYPINILCSMCDDGFDIMNLSSLKIDIKVVRDLFMYGLKYENKKITQNQAGNLMDAYFESGGTFDELVDEVMKSLNKSLGGKEENKEESEEGEGK